MKRAHPWFVSAICIGAVLAGGLGDASARVVRSLADLQPQPSVMRYDPAKDKFFRHESVYSTLESKRRGGDISYGGDRQTQFQFLGKPGRGGIYDALEGYRRELRHDAKNYRYHR